MGEQRAASQRVLRPRRKVARRRVLQAWQTAPAGAGTLPGAPPEDAPPLGMREPEGARGALVSGSLAALLHAAGLGALLLGAWLAPEEVREKLIPVKILDSRTAFEEKVEAPGSNETPAPGPRSIAPRAPRSAAALAAAMAAAPEPARPTQAAADVQPRRVETARVDDAPAPRRVERRRVEEAPVEAARDAERAAALDVATLSPVQVDPGELSAPEAKFRAPRAVESRAPSAVTAPRAFANYRGVDSRAHEGAAIDPGSAAAAGSGHVPSGALDTGVSGFLLSGGGGGGAPGGSGTGSPDAVPCLQSAFVDRYLKLIETRTTRRWRYPDRTRADSVVKLRFQIDVTGTPTRVESVAAPSEELGRSAVEALRAAAPFPAMDASNRCLAEWTVIGTFTANPTS